MLTKFLNKNCENLFEYINLSLKLNDNSNSIIKDELINSNNYIILNNYTFSELIVKIDFRGEFYIIDKSNDLLKKLYFENFDKENFSKLISNASTIMIDFLNIKDILFVIPYKSIISNKLFSDFAKNFYNSNYLNEPFSFYPVGLITFKDSIITDSVFFVLNNMSKEMIPLLFEGISADHQNKFSESLKKNEIECIIDFILTSNKIICDKDYLDECCIENDYWNIPIDNNIEGIVYYSLPNGIRINLSFNFKNKKDNFYIFSYVNILSEQFLKLSSLNVQRYIKNIYSYNFEVIYLNSFNSKNQF